MRTQEPFLPLLHLPAITAALADGEKCTVIGSRFGISAARIRMFARVNGYVLTRGTKRSSGVSRAIAERNTQIVRLREGGAYYAEIGKRFGVTGERIRQVLRAAGRADLAGWETLRRRHTITTTCAACGAAFSHQTSQKSNYCGRECRNRHAGTWAPRIPEIVAMRRGGKKWREIAAHYGTKDMCQIPGMLKRLASRRGLDLGGVISDRPRVWKSRVPEIEKLRAEGLVWREIGEHFGTTGDNVWTQMRYHAPHICERRRGVA